MNFVGYKMTSTEIMDSSIQYKTVNPLLHRDAFANRADPDQAAFVIAA